MTMNEKYIIENEVHIKLGDHFTLISLCPNKSFEGSFSWIKSRSKSKEIQKNEENS